VDVELEERRKRGGTSLRTRFTFFCMSFFERIVNIASVLYDEDGTLDIDRESGHTTTLAYK
jgi:hypothetical protein